MPHRGLGLGSLDPLPENFSGSSLDVMLHCCLVQFALCISHLTCVMLMQVHCVGCSTGCQKVKSVVLFECL